MRKYGFLLFLLLLTTTSLFAQNENWRRGRHDYRDAPSDDAFELTPFVGYRWGGTIFADQTNLFHRDVEVKPSADFGVDLGIPLGDTGLKLELMANHQSSTLRTDTGIFQPDNRVADVDVNYVQAGLQIPFARSRNATPYVVVSGGLATIDPQVTNVSAENRFAASAGIGVKVPVNRNLSLRLEGRGYYTSLGNGDCRVCDYFVNEDFTQGEVNMGFVFSF
ncbi:MAG: outer membrane beta-barrel protein [Acidobacteria bacterium]|nr:outer membrane beta-barrel protein [Acidobacteriota bacterium]MBV9475241.1 outer membrane beta-barrel protein [Acidobacteriota bacterium]